MKIKANDNVELISGNDKGTRGTVRVAMPKTGQVIVSGAKIVRKHQKRTANMRTEPGIIELEAPIRVSNVMLVCPHCDRATRVGYQVSEEGAKQRVCKKCHETID